MGAACPPGTGTHHDKCSAFTSDGRAATAASGGAMAFVCPCSEVVGTTGSTAFPDVWKAALLTPPVLTLASTVAAATAAAQHYRTNEYER